MKKNRKNDKDDLTTISPRTAKAIIDRLKNDKEFMDLITQVRERTQPKEEPKKEPMFDIVAIIDKSGSMQGYDKEIDSILLHLHRLGTVKPVDIFDGTGSKMSVLNKAIISNQNVKKLNERGHEDRPLMVIITDGQLDNDVQR
jgi:Mg-chelatase subunit ChlD